MVHTSIEERVVDGAMIAHIVAVASNIAGWGLGRPLINTLTDRSLLKDWNPCVRANRREGLIMDGSGTPHVLKPVCGTSHIKDLHSLLTLFLEDIGGQTTALRELPMANQAAHPVEVFTAVFTSQILFLGVMLSKS